MPTPQKDRLAHEDLRKTERDKEGWEGGRKGVLRQGDSRQRADLGQEGREQETRL